MSAGKRKALPEAEDDASLKAKLKAEGWRFSSDAKPAPVLSADDVADKLRASVCQSGELAVPEVLQALKADKREAVKEAACTAVAWLAERDVTRAAVIKAHGTEAIVEVLQSEPLPTAGIIQRALAALANLALGEGSNDVLEANGVAAVLSCMSQRPSAEVQSKGCLALNNMAFSSDGEARVIAAGGVGAILSALLVSGTASLAPAFQCVAEEACDAVANLVTSEAGREALRAEAERQELGHEGDEHGLLQLVQQLEGTRALYPECASVKDCLEAVMDAMGEPEDE